jgi:PleD family two-component response regulator
MGGTITVSSTVGQGSVFSLAIVLGRCSRADFLNAGIGQADIITQFNPTNGKKVLIVEDNKLNQLLLKKMVEELGLGCDVADDGQEAFEKTLTDQKYSLILMDYLMPRMNGIEAFHKIRQS